jgi:hypothetical protein
MSAVFFMSGFPSPTREFSHEGHLYADDDRSAVYSMRALKIVPLELKSFMLMPHVNLLSQYFTYFSNAVAKSLASGNMGNPCCITVPIWSATLLAIL